MAETITLSLVLGATPFLISIKSYIKSLFQEIRESVKIK